MLIAVILVIDKNWEDVHQHVPGLTNYGISTQWYISWQWKGKNYRYRKGMDEIQIVMLNERSQRKAYAVWFHSYKILGNTNIYGDRKQIRNCLLRELDEGMNTKRNYLLCSLYW